MRLVKDSKGHKSWHVTLGVIWTTVFSIKAAFSGHDLTVASFHIITASFPGAEYALYIAPWLVAMGFRDWNLKGTLNGNDSSQPTG